MSELIRIGTEIASALESRHPVVALETTLVTHGFPYPVGLEVALELERLVRETGAVAATIGVLDGAACVGMTVTEIERLATGDPRPAKVNLGNLAATIAARRLGSTTVAATVAVAAAAGIRILATGGIGGVHRGAADTGDVSADLGALARYPVAVVCSGAKAVLDLPRTLEALETAGVPVVGYRTETLPAFYRRDSGLALDGRVDSVAELAAVADVHFRLRLGGLVAANPIPAGAELDRTLYESWIEQALAEVAGDVSGRDVTPRLLSALDRISGGAAVTANRALLEANARLAGHLAVALARDIPEAR